MTEASSSDLGNSWWNLLAGPLVATESVELEIYKTIYFKRNVSLFLTKTSARYKSLHDITTYYILSSFGTLFKIHSTSVKIEGSVRRIERLGPLDGLNG